MLARGYRDLKVWGKAMDFAEGVYALSRSLPREERFGITGQLLRAAASVPANIAEGYQRSTRKDFAHFVSIARGSLAESETFLLLAERVGLAPPEALQDVLRQADEISRMLTRLRQRLNQPPRLSCPISQPS